MLVHLYYNTLQDDMHVNSLFASPLLKYQQGQRGTAADQRALGLGAVRSLGETLNPYTPGVGK